MNNELHIAIDGPVGAGKSTLMDLLTDVGFTPFPEPVVENTLLEKFYYDRERYGFPLQIYLLNKRFEHLRKSHGTSKSVMDRSLYCDLIFARILLNNQELSPAEFHIYEELLSNMLEHCQPPTLMIYLEISVDTAIARIQKRNRDFEQKTERKYWEDLNNAYRSYFESYSYSPLLKINVDQLDFDQDEHDKQRVLAMIERKLVELNAPTLGRKIG